MRTLRAHVRNGRLLLDEPTDLPEGSEVTLLTEGAAATDIEAQRALYEALLEGSDELDEGLGEDAEEVLARLEAIVQARVAG
jgi:hypothetical protein